MGHMILVVPCYNEAARLAEGLFDGPGDTWACTGGLDECKVFQGRTCNCQLIRSAHDLAHSRHRLEFLFVNDGSSDGTLDMLRSLERSCRVEVDVMDQEPNRGKAEAVRQGLLRAIERGPDFVGFWDADMATPLSALPDFVQTLEERPNIEIVMGARVKLLGRLIERYPWRHYSGRVFATLVSLMLRIPVYDTQCGAKVFRVTDDLYELFSKPFVSPWLFDVEVLARYLALRREEPFTVGERIFELPLQVWRDMPGSKLTGLAYLRAAMGVSKIFWAYRRELRTGR